MKRQAVTFFYYSTYITYSTYTHNLALEYGLIYQHNQRPFGHYASICRVVSFGLSGRQFWLVQWSLLVCGVARSGESAPEADLI